MKGFIPLFISIVFLTACTPASTQSPTQTHFPTSTYTISPEITATKTKWPTNTRLPTREPTFVTLGSPFSPDCGDGMPRIWSNDSYNGKIPLDYDSKMDDHHGHVDFFKPSGCNIFAFDGEVISPADGYLSTYNKGIIITLPEGVYLSGMDKALDFIGIQDPNILLVNNVRLMIAHVKLIGVVGQTTKSSQVADIIPEMGHHKIAYQIDFRYKNDSYIISPTLLDQEHGPWPCVSGSPYDCDPEPNDYAP